MFDDIFTIRVIIIMLFLPKHNTFTIFTIFYLFVDIYVLIHWCFFMYKCWKLRCTMISIILQKMIIQDDWLNILILHIKNHTTIPWIYPCWSCLLPSLQLWQSSSLWWYSSGFCVWGISWELLWWVVSFTLFLWHILVLLSWNLHRLKIRFVDIKTTNNSKQCNEGHLCEGYSSSKHDFYYEIPMLRHKMIRVRALFEVSVITKHTQTGKHWGKNTSYK